MFKSNNTGDNVTRDEARQYVEGIDRRISSLRAEGAGALERLETRLRSLEGLAAELQRVRSNVARVASNVAPLPVRTPFQGVTKAEATEAYDHLLTVGEAKFNELGAKLDQIVQALAEEYGDDDVEGDVTSASTVDYGAVAFGLSEIKRKVAANLSSAVPASEYEGTVQYFADVFAKADPNFDADAFKVQAGVGNGGTSGTYTPQHP